MPLHAIPLLTDTYPTATYRIVSVSTVTPLDNDNHTLRTIHTSSTPQVAELVVHIVIMSSYSEADSDSGFISDNDSVAIDDDDYTPPCSTASTPTRVSPPATR